MQSHSGFVYTEEGILPELLEPASAGCRLMVLAIVSSCINFSVFSFVIVSNY